jgi:hypothetical protein
MAILQFEILAVVGGFGHRREERWSEPQGATAGFPNVAENFGRRNRRGQEPDAEPG